MVLSNQHVLDGPVGTQVVQPSPIGLDDSLEIGFQLDICNPAHLFRLDTPNTTVVAYWPVRQSLPPLLLRLATMLTQRVVAKMPRRRRPAREPCSKAKR